MPVVDKMQRRDIIFKPLLHSALRLNNKSHRIMDTPVQCCSGADRPPFHDLSRTEGQEDDLELQVKLSVRPPSHKDKIEPVRDFAFTSHCTSTSLVNAPPSIREADDILNSSPFLFHSPPLLLFTRNELHCRRGVFLFKHRPEELQLRLSSSNVRCTCILFLALGECLLVVQQYFPKLTVTLFSSSLHVCHQHHHHRHHHDHWSAIHRLQFIASFSLFIHIE